MTKFRSVARYPELIKLNHLNLIRTVEAQGRIAEAGKQKETAMFLQTLRSLQHKK